MKCCYWSMGTYQVYERPNSIMGSLFTVLIVLLLKDSITFVKLFFHLHPVPPPSTLLSTWLPDPWTQTDVLQTRSWIWCTRSNRPARRLCSCDVWLPVVKSGRIMDVWVQHFGRSAWRKVNEKMLQKKSHNLIKVRPSKEQMDWGSAWLRGQYDFAR